MNIRSVPGVVAALTALLLLWPVARSQIISEGRDLDAAKSLVVMIDGNLDGQPTQGAGIVFAVANGWTYIVTAYHIVRKGDTRATNLRVRFWQSQREIFPAEHYDDAKQEYDLAVLRVRALQAGFPFQRLADPEQLKKSQPVYAIGHPNGEGPWNVTYLPGAIGDIETLRLKVQSPSIKEGHSGGALIDERKMIIGMVQDTDGTTADILRIDRAAEILRRDLHLTVELSAGTAGPTYNAVGPPPSPTGSTPGTAPGEVTAKDLVTMEKLSRSPSIVGWAVGDKGITLHTEDGGRGWRPQNSGATEDLYSVTFATPLSGWAVGDKGIILHTEDGGSSWKQQQSRTHEILRSVAFATPQSGWAVGDMRIILHTEDGGGSWKQQYIGLPTAVRL